jgi:hypothetical protein
VNWSEHIPLLTLLAVVFSAGVFYAQQAVIKRDLRSLVDKTVPRIHERLDGFEKWQTEHDTEARTRRRVRTEGQGVPVYSDE